MKLKAPMLKIATWIQRFWLAAVCIGLLGLVWALDAPAWAAPAPAYRNQTVPRPTPTSDGDPVSTATPRPDDDGDTVDVTEEGSGAVIGSNPLEGLIAEPTKMALMANVAVTTLNLREGPGTEYGVVGSVSQGATLTVFSRNAAGSWWYVCCVAGTDTAGWASAELMETAGFDRGQANGLLPVFGEEIGAAAVQPATNITTTDLPLMFQISLIPPYAWQGQRAQMILAVANPNKVPIVDAELSDELPSELTVANVKAMTGGTIRRERAPGGRTLVLVAWPEIGPGKTVTATIAVTVTQALSDGAVIDNLAAVRADNSQYTTSAITIGMPPATLPDFR